MIRKCCLLLCLSGYLSFGFGQRGADKKITENNFVKRSGTRFLLKGKAYYYIGANYWYGSVLGLQSDPKHGIGRLRKELDFLAKNGVEAAQSAGIF